jgi:hypothetical protein
MKTEAQIRQEIEELERKYATDKLWQNLIIFQIVMLKEVL